MPMPPVGVTTVRCPVCRAAVGRPCHNRRGYLIESGAHRERHTAWMVAEHAEARRVRVSSGLRPGATPAATRG